MPVNTTSAAKTVTLYNYQLTALTIYSISAPAALCRFRGNVQHHNSTGGEFLLHDPVDVDADGFGSGRDRFTDSRHRCPEQSADGGAYRDGRDPNGAFRNRVELRQRGGEHDQRRQDRYPVQLPTNGAHDLLNFGSGALSCRFRGALQHHNSTGGEFLLHDPVDVDADGFGSGSCDFADRCHERLKQSADVGAERRGREPDGAVGGDGSVWQRGGEHDQRGEDRYPVQLPANGAHDLLDFDRRPMPVSGGTCTTATPLAASANCTILLTLTPTGTGAVAPASLTVATDASNKTLGANRRPPHGPCRPGASGSPRRSGQDRRRRRPDLS